MEERFGADSATNIAKVALLHGAEKARPPVKVPTDGHDTRRRNGATR